MQFWPRRGHSAPRRQQSAAGSPFQAHQCERPGQSCHHECYIGEMFASLLNARDRYYMIAASLGRGAGDSDHVALAHTQRRHLSDRDSHERSESEAQARKIARLPRLEQ